MDLIKDCIKVAGMNVWGPVSIEDDITDPRLTLAQLKYIYDHYNGVILVLSHLGKWGI